MGKDPSAKSQKEKHGQATHIFDEALESSNLLGFCGSDYALPPGTFVEKEKGYEILHVHPPRVTPEFEALQAKLPSIKIAELDELAQQCFRGVERLNTIQSVVYETVTGSDENLLVCAPTGSGKTNIALLSILREVREAYNRYEFKVIYIAPLRALTSEITSKFKQQLKGLGLNVLKVTGEETPSRNAIEEAQVLVVTPEKWEILTRRFSAGRFVNNVRLMIFDGVHMLQTDRGPVVEAIIVRALNEHHGGKRVRIVGLSATLPNYRDVARFLHVNEERGLFYFDQRFRAVPLTQSFMGLDDETRIEKRAEMDRICYDQCVNCAMEEQQVIVFTHSRKVAMELCGYFDDLATSQQQKHLFQPTMSVAQSSEYQRMRSDMDGAQHKELRVCLPLGFGFHHAGVSRRDRNLVERAFHAGYIRVLVSTATLAWGINLPAHTVIIRMGPTSPCLCCPCVSNISTFQGTDVYDRVRGCFKDLDVLDVQQIFGRAGRPQFDSSGNGILIGMSRKVQKYVKHLTSRTPIESLLPSRLNDLLCAEVIRGTVTSVHRAIDWLQQTYFFIRYPTKNKSEEKVRTELMQMCFKAAQSLSDVRMIKFSATGEEMRLDGDLLGRIAYRFYLTYDTIRRLTSTDGPVRLDKKLTVATALALISKADDFNNIYSREAELEDLDDLYNGLPHKEPIEEESMASSEGKVNRLLQWYISRVLMDEESPFALEVNLILDSAPRVASAFYEIVRDYLRAANATQVALSVSKAIELRQWPHSSPLWTMCSKNLISRNQVNDFQDRTLESLIHLATNNKQRHPNRRKLCHLILALPTVEVDARVYKAPVRYGSDLSVVVSPQFNWNEEVHGGGCKFTVFVEDAVNDSLVLWHEMRFHSLSPLDIQRFVSDAPDYVWKNYLVRLVSNDFMMPDVVVQFEQGA